MCALSTPSAQSAPTKKNQKHRFNPIKNPLSPIYFFNKGENWIKMD